MTPAPSALPALAPALAAAIAAAAAAACRSSPAPAHAASVHEPALLLVHEDAVDNASGEVAVAVHGSGLGAAAPGSFREDACGTPVGGAFVVLRDAAGAALFTARSTEASEVVSWTDARVVLRAPGAAAAAARFEVCTSGAHLAGAVTRWAYDHVDVPPSPGTSAAPLAVALDAAGRLFLNEEFHTRFHVLEGAAAPGGAQSSAPGEAQGSAPGEAQSSWLAIDLPQAAGPGIFAQTVFGDTPSRIATLGEAVAVDPRGRAWFGEAGPAPYRGPNANHARVGAYDPATGRLDLWAVPGDANGVVGVAWDEGRRRVWFSQARRSSRGTAPGVALEARLTSFDPDSVPADGGDLAFAPGEACLVPAGAGVGACSATASRRCVTDADCALADRVCPPGAGDRPGCFREYELPSALGVELPSQLLVHSDGSLWYSAYWGGRHVGRLDPATGAVDAWPLPAPAGQRSCSYAGCDCFAADPARRCAAHCCQYLLLGAGPWSLVEGAGGEVFGCGQASLALFRVDASAPGRPACRALDAGGANPCVTVWPVPGASPGSDLLHSIALDAAGRVWFTLSPAVGHERDPAHPASVGWLDPGSGRVFLFPPLSAYGMEDAGGFVGFGGAGIAVDAGGAAWFADYFRRRVGRLRPLP
ncbi:MAG TPA: hypothetical protein VFP65_29575 [Anaeromyxobacteraceae bacterium]|nr:hypothetical protein [Anaeromyxobacteraceae bacterium]